MRTFIKCAKILPHLRECRFCRHLCTLRMEKYIDPDLEKAEIEHNEDIADEMRATGQLAETEA